MTVPIDNTSLWIKTGGEGLDRPSETRLKVCLSMQVAWGKGKSTLTWHSEELVLVLALPASNLPCARP